MPEFEFEPASTIVFVPSIVNTILHETVGCPENIRSKNYVEGKQWKRGGIETGTGLLVIDKKASERNYVGLVQNLIEDGIETMASFALGEEELESTSVSTENELTNEWLKNININRITKELYEVGLTYEDAYMYIWRENEEIKMKVLSPLNVTTFDGSYFVAEVIKQEEQSILKKEEGRYRITEFTWQQDGTVAVFRHIIKGSKLEETEYLYSNSIMPFYKFDLDFDYLSLGVFQNQDLINIKYTKHFDIEKYNSDPLTVIKTDTSLGDQTFFDTGSSSTSSNNGNNSGRGRQTATPSFEAGPGSVLMVNREDSVEKILGSNVDQVFIEGLKESKADLWKKLSLFGLKNSDLTGGQVSGTALFWKLSETYSYASKMRNTFKLEFYKMLKFWYDQTFMPVFDVKEIYLSPLKGEKLKEEELKKTKMESAKLKMETIKGLLEAGYTRDEAEFFISENTK